MMRRITMNSVLAAALLGLVSTAHAACNSATIAAQAPDSRYTLQNADTEVLDNQTGLIWQRCSVGLSGAGCATGAASISDWKVAIELASGSWRLPNIKELTSLLETQCSSPAINATIFPATSAAAYWASSPDTALAANAWQVNFAAGAVSSVVKTDAAFVRLVRDNPNP